MKNLLLLLVDWGMGAMLIGVFAVVCIAMVLIVIVCLAMANLLQTKKKMMQIMASILSALCTQVVYKVINVRITLMFIKVQKGA